MEKRAINFFIKRPNARRRSFAIYKRIENSDGTTSNETISLKEIDAINNQFQASVIDQNTALKNLEKIKKNLLRNEGLATPTLTFHQDNEKVLNHYWENRHG